VTVGCHVVWLRSSLCQLDFAFEAIREGAVDSEPPLTIICVDHSPVEVRVLAQHFRNHFIKCARINKGIRLLRD